MKKAALLLFSFLFCLFGVAALAVEPIKFGISSSNAPPLLYQFENKSMPIATGGFIYDVTVAIADELQEKHLIVTVPRGRIPQELTSGNIDVICHASPLWNLPYENEVLWSKPLYTYSNVLVSRGPIPFKSLAQIPSAAVGTVKDFYYAELEERFKKKKLLRDDAASVDANMSKLIGERIDYVVMSEIEFNYYKKLYPTIQRSSFSEDTTKIQCTLSKMSFLSLTKLNKAIDRLTKKKVLQKILERYTTTDKFPKPLVYGLNNNNSPPFLIFEKDATSEVIKGGVFFDIGLAIARHIQRPMTFVLLPRGRLDASLADGHIDLVCYDTEVWSGKYASQYNWSEPIFKQINYVVYSKNLKSEREPKTLADLKGSTIGTVLHFVYHSLAPYFNDGSIRREDADSGMANVLKLQTGRVPYIILNNLEYEYYKKEYPLLQRTPVDLDPVDVKCAVSKKSDLKIEFINQAINEMEKSGKLQQVFAQ